MVLHSVLGCGERGESNKMGFVEEQATGIVSGGFDVSLRR